MKATTLVKFGGELLEQPERLAALAAMLAPRPPSARAWSSCTAAGARSTRRWRASASPKRQVDGLRVTDMQTMGVVVEVLAGAVNTRLVAAITAAGGRAVGLTGADAGLAIVEKAAPHVTVDGQTVDLGLVGEPVDDGTPALLRDLVRPATCRSSAASASDTDGTLYNVNADTLAGHLAARLQVRRLVIAGATPGVLDGSGQTVARLDRAGAEAMVQSGVASAGMIAKLRASMAALAAGVEEVVLVDGRDAQTLASLLEAPAWRPRRSVPGTRMVA